MTDECICNNPECWGYTCPVHRRVCRAEARLRDPPDLERERRRALERERPAPDDDLPF